MERALLRLGVHPTYVTYRTEYVPTMTRRLVLCKREVCYSTALTVVTVMDIACGQALGWLLS
jgi:hypothetical protein